MKKGFLDGYKTYDENERGGRDAEWRSAFNQRFVFGKAGITEAKVQKQLSKGRKISFEDEV